MSVLTAENLNIAYGRRQILENTSFSVEKGETLVIAGLSGSGKTTLCHALCGLIPRVLHTRFSGRVSMAGEDIKNYSLFDLATAVGLVFQDADTQIICTQVEDELAFGLENLCVPPAEIRSRVDAMLRRFGLWDLRHENPARLSGGQKRLVTLASVLILEPRVLILDEPMTTLDASGKALVYRTIADLRLEGRTLIIVEHDLQRVTWADRWLILADGRVAALESPLNLMENPAGLRELGLWPEGGV